MASFNLRIESTSESASIAVDSEGFGGDDLSCHTPAEVLVKILGAINALQMLTEEEDVEEVEAEIEEEAEEPEEQEAEEPLNEIDDFIPKKSKAKQEKPVKPTKAKPDDSEWDGYLSNKDVAEKLGCTEGALSVRISTGKFPRADKKIGIKNAWEEETVTDWLYSQNKPTKPKKEERVEGDEDLEEDEGEVEILEPIEEDEGAPNDRAKDLLGDF